MPNVCIILPTFIFGRSTKCVGDQETNSRSILHITRVYPQGAPASRQGVHGDGRRRGNHPTHCSPGTAVTMDSAVCTREGACREEATLAWVWEHGPAWPGTRAGRQSVLPGSDRTHQRQRREPGSALSRPRSRERGCWRVTMWKSTVFFLWFPSIPQLAFLFFKPPRVKLNREMTTLITT